MSRTPSISQTPKRRSRRTGTRAVESGQNPETKLLWSRFTPSIRWKKTWYIPRIRRQLRWQRKQWLDDITDWAELVFSGRELTFTFANCRRNSVCRLLSVCCLSVTLVHPSQVVELFGNFFHHTIAQGIYFSGAKNRWWGTPLSLFVQSDRPPFK